MKLKFTLLFSAFFAIYNLNAQSVNIEGNPYSGNPYTTIIDAIIASQDGDVILISGIHTESISISKSITLRGSDPKTDIIQAAATEVKDGTGGRVITISGGDKNISIENLGIRHGNNVANGSGIFIDKVVGQVNLSNLTIENNYTTKNGGGLSFAGSNVDIINCTIRNNTSVQDGGAVIAAPNNDAGSDNIINIKQSLINNNFGRNGGAIYINGNKGFGNNFKIGVNIENSTISNNTANSPEFGAGGGAIWSKGSTWTGDGVSGNVTLSLVYTTFFNNLCTLLPRSGLNFTGDPAGSKTNFSVYNSIIIAENDLNTKVFLNLGNTITTNVKNSIIGGIDGTVPTLFTDIANNNEINKTQTFSGLSGTLSDQGGKTQVITIIEGSNSNNFCTSSVPFSLPTIDQRGATRQGTPDAGAYELDGTLSARNEIFKNASVKIFPNPARYILNINSLNAIKKINIYEITGKQVFQSYKIDNNSLDVSNLNVGVYIMRVEDVNKNFSTEKLVISR